MANRPKNKRMCLMKNDEFSFLENDFSFINKGKKYNIPYDNYQFLFNKFISTFSQCYPRKISSGFENMGRNHRPEEKECITKQFRDFVLKSVKFRTCLSCEEDFLSINAAHRRCAPCTKHFQDILYRPFKMWGEKII